MIKDFLKSLRKKTVTLDELQQNYGVADYDKLYLEIQELLSQRMLLPVKSSGCDFRGLPRKYSIAKGILNEGHVAKINETVQAGEFSSLFSFSWYYAHSEMIWQRELPYIRQLNDYIRKYAGRKPEPCGIQQRSFEIFYDEKVLLDHEEILSHVGISREQLAIVSQPEPLMLALNPAIWHNGNKDKHMHLAVENKAVYYGLLPYLSSTGLTSLIWGSGWKLVGNIGQLPEQIGCPDSNHEVYYFGDFDAEGLSIWHSLGKDLPGNIRLSLAGSFYEAMLDYQPAKGKEYQKVNQEAVEAFCSCLEPEKDDIWRKILQAGKYYPQEVLPKDILWKCCQEAGF